MVFSSIHSYLWLLMKTLTVNTQIFVKSMYMHVLLYLVLKSNYHIKAWRSCSVLFPSRYRWWYHIVCSYSYHIYEKFLLLFFQFPSWSEWTQKHYTPKVEEINVVFPRIAIRIDKLATTRRTFRARFCDDFCTMNHGLYAFTDPPPSSVSRECSDSSSGKMKAMRLVNTIPNI